MRTFVRMLFCGVVIAGMGGCGGGSGTTIPKKFTPPPQEVGAKAVDEEPTNPDIQPPMPTKGPGARKGG
jgi:hypothetical protein